MENGAIRPEPVDAEGFSIPEYGVVNLQFIDSTKSYKGRMYRLSKETARQISETAGFSANFEIPGIKMATMDLFKSEGTILVEMERQAQSGDVVLRYMRERWSETEEASAEDGSFTRKSYRAHSIPATVLASIGAQLRIPQSELQSFVIRVNFKDRTGGLIAEDQLADLLPIGSYSSFVLNTTASGSRPVPGEHPPTPDAVPAPAMSSAESLSFKEQKDHKGIIADNATPSSVASEHLAPSHTCDLDSPDQAEATVRTEPSSSALPPEKPATEPLSNPRQNILTSKVRTKSDFNESSLPPSPFARARAGVLIAEGNSTPREFALSPLSDSRTTTNKSTDNKPSTASDLTPVNSPQRNRVYSRYDLTETPDSREALTRIIATTISAQQETFFEAMQQQQRSFGSASDSLLSRFDQAQQRLEGTVAAARESTRIELASLKREVSKELEQYHTQVNKAVMPVAKFLEENSSDKPRKEKMQLKDLQSSSLPATPDSTLRNLMMLSIAILIGTLVAILWVIYPQTASIEHMKKQLDELSAKSGSPGPGEDAPVTNTQSESTNANQK